MRFPDSFLDDLRARLTLSDVVGRKVTWDRRKSAPGRGDYWAPCPFHHEKTPSFHADDRRGIYKCFGCGAGGDLFKFVMETENLSFAEAVERLAAEAGVALPDRGERRERQEDPKKPLLDAMEAAIAFYRRAFGSAAGKGARDYAQRRGLSPETLERFEIGYAPSGGALARFLAERDQTAAGVEAGLLIVPEDASRGSAPFDRFRDRLMFPIRDPRGRAIAFGGRALSPNAQAKYLNSPETPLFSKAHVLYNEREARAAAGKAGTLLVAEGYMDVIALSAAGFAHAVAPLGTALTETQLQRLWRMAEEPVIALDGDAAGLRAAHRVVDLALPHLAPGRSLGFCLMPQGRDPDDVLRDGGASAMQALVGAAVPLVEMLWRREVGAGPLDTPERRAGFDRRLRDALGRIADRTVRGHYASALGERRSALFGAPRGTSPAAAGRGTGRRPGRGPRVPEGPRAPTLALAQQWTAISDTAERAAARAREATVLLLAAHAPEAATALAVRIEEMPLTAEDLAPAREAVLDLLYGECSALDGEIARRLAAVAPARIRVAALRASGTRTIATELAETIERHAACLARHVALRSAGEALSRLPALDAGDLSDAVPLDEVASEDHRARAAPERRAFAAPLKSYCAIADRPGTDDDEATRAGILDDPETRRLLQELGYDAKNA